MIGTPLVRRFVHPVPRSSDDQLARVVVGRVVLITGASHGIGRATAQRLGRAGARLLLVARSQDVLEELAAELPGAQPFPCDLSDEEAVAALVPRLQEAHGHVDFVVSNAGRSIRRALAGPERLHDVTRTAAVNYHGPVALLLGLLPAMRARGEGHIVNVSTVGVRLPPAGRWGAYVASKGAFDLWLRAAAAETSADGVTATSVYLGLVHTRMSAPTTELRGLPGLTPDEASALIADALVRRPPAIVPWWATLAAVGAQLAPGAAARAMRSYDLRLESGNGSRAA